MAIATSITLYGSITGLQVSSLSQVGPLSLPGANSDAANGMLTLTLQNGDNTIPIPSTNTLYALVTFAPTSATTKKIKGAGGDTGITVHPVNPYLLSFAGGGASPASFIINSSALDTGLTTEIRFW